MANLPGNMSRELIRAPEPIIVGQINQQAAAVFAGKLNMPDRNLKSLGSYCISVRIVVFEHLKQKELNKDP